MEWVLPVLPWGNPGVTWLQAGQSQENPDRFKPIRSLQWEARAWCCRLTAVQSHYNSMVTGFSKNLQNSASHCAPTAPSTTRWSQLNVTDIMLATSNLQVLTVAQSESLERKCVWLVVTHGPFLVIRRHQPFLWASDGEDTGLRGVDYCREVLDTKHPQIRDCESASLEEKISYYCSWLD